MADDSFDDFYARYARRLLAFARAVYGRADADDIAQEAMTRAWRSYDALDAGRDPWPWLTAIARNVARDRHDAAPADVPLPDVPARQPDTVGAVEERQVLRAALGRLSSTDRHMLVLRELHDLTFDELATLTGRSTNTVRQQAFRARQRLRAAYASVGGRAGAFLGGLRWPWPEAPAAAAAVVVAGALATGTVPPPDSPARAPQTQVAAGPAARGGATTGPAAGRAAPVRPLQPLRAARVVEPRPAEARQVERVRQARTAERIPAEEVRTEVGDGTGYRRDRRRGKGEMLPCVVAGLCQKIPG